MAEIHLSHDRHSSRRDVNHEKRWQRPRQGYRQALPAAGPGNVAPGATGRPATPASPGRKRRNRARDPNWRRTAGLYLALQNHYFLQAGLTVKVNQIAKSIDAIPEMQAGKIDVVTGANYVSFFQAAEVKHLPLKLLVDGESCTDDTFEVLAKPSSGITSPSGLAHKTIAVNIKNNIQTMLTNTALQTAGVNPASVTYVQIPFPMMGDALRKGAVDAISVVEPFITENELNLGAQPVMSTCTGPTANFPISGDFALSTFTQKYPNTARAFQAALERGQALADSNRASVSEILPTYIKGLIANQAAVVNLGQYPTGLDKTHLQRVADAMANANLSPAFKVGSLLFH